jgi:hypothetical protein
LAFLEAGAKDIGGTLVWLKDGRDVWDIFRDVRFIGNSRADPCSRLLKREPAQKWVTENTDSATTTLYVGMDWTETNRTPAVIKNWKPWTVEFPLFWEPLLGKRQLIDLARERGLTLPVLYDMGMPHANCGGFCIKSGHAQFRMLLQNRPEAYAYHERREEELRQMLDKDVAVMRDRRGAGSSPSRASKPLTLKAFRERMEADDTDCDLFDWGGCGCFTDYDGPVKTCTKCQRSLPLTAFSRNRRAKDGLCFQCKDCHRSRLRRS